MTVSYESWCGNDASTTAITVPSGSNRLFFFTIKFVTGGLSGTPTFGGVNMTELVNTGGYYVFAVVDANFPSTGSQNVVWSGTGDASFGAWIVSGASQDTDDLIIEYGTNSGQDIDIALTGADFASMAVWASAGGTTSNNFTPQDSATERSDIYWTWADSKTRWTALDKESSTSIHTYYNRSDHGTIYYTAIGVVPPSEGVSNNQVICF